MSNEDLPPTTPRPPRESLLPSSQRWVTNLYSSNSTSDPEPPIDNPSIPNEVNAQLRKDYEQLQKLNQIAQALTEKLEQTRGNFEAFEATVDQTDHLLDLWTNLLSQSERTKQRLEDPQYQGSHNSTTNTTHTHSSTSSLPPGLQQLQQLHLHHSHPQQQQQNLKRTTTTAMRRHTLAPSSSIQPPSQHNPPSKRLRRSTLVRNPKRH
ncbi:DASH complex subunit Duo1-domain-containing protein [Zychaea mexicana]|uniref:DASH complex subunit Duo1-domain-containing protein n=1 Tax=Zychaea mexicana TaxID=64656 RepID=UPI0022FDDB2D|nr:DASH complex subunit Duo1-domain-containing protein [Zychaea mexicana]KAI9489289.1 DASH complex subunit Duo1-domain-containing protein [Zychaea mexicana]